MRPCTSGSNVPSARQRGNCTSRYEPESRSPSTRAGLLYAYACPSESGPKGITRTNSWYSHRASNSAVSRTGTGSKSMYPLTKRGSVLVVPPAPLVGRSLRVSGRRVLPRFLPPERRQVEEGPDRAERFDPASSCEVGAQDFVAVAQENAETECLALVGRDPEILVEIAAG